jgi:hypothetical protein
MEDDKKEEVKKQPQQVKQPKSAEAIRKRDQKFAELKDKKKQGGPKLPPNLFSTRVTDKGDAPQVSAYLNAEMVRHCAYKKTKKDDQDAAVIYAIDKFEKSGETIVTEGNVGEYFEGKSLVETVIAKIKAMKENGSFADNNLCVP